MTDGIAGKPPGGSGGNGALMDGANGPVGRSGCGGAPAAMEGNGGGAGIVGCGGAVGAGGIG